MLTTRRQKETQAVKVLALCAKGYSLKQCAEEMKCTIKTVRRTLNGITDEAREGLLTSFLSSRLPLAVELTLELHRVVVSKCMALAESESEPRIKLESWRLATATRAESNKILAEAEDLAESIQRQRQTLLVVRQPTLTATVATPSAIEEETN